jgi:N-methylhydantoinase A
MVLEGPSVQTKRAAGEALAHDQRGSKWVVGVDVGGTFTDFYAFDRITGSVRVHKTPSTPENPAKAVTAGLRWRGLPQ